MRQRPVPRQRTHVRRAPRRGSVHPALTHRAHPPRASHDRLAGRYVEFFHRFCRRIRRSGHDPFAMIERLLAGITEKRGELSLYAVPTFLWFSTRLFAGVRTALNDIYDVSLRPTPAPGGDHPVSPGQAARRGDGCRHGHLVSGEYVADDRAGHPGGARDRDRAPARVLRVHRGALSGGAPRLQFSVSLFYVTYSYASVRRLPWKTALSPPPSPRCCSRWPSGSMPCTSLTSPRSRGSAAMRIWVR